MKDLDEGRDIVLEFDLNQYTSTSIPTTFENQLIYAIGTVNTHEILRDPIFGISSQYNDTNGDSTMNFDKKGPYLKLSRCISMYQWEETTSGKSTSYSETWSSTLIDSSRFRKKSSSRTNPRSFPFNPYTITADSLFLGNKIVLNEDIVNLLIWHEKLDSIDLNYVTDTQLRSRLTKYKLNEFYYHHNGNTTTNSVNQPLIGDTRILFEAVEPDTISIIAQLHSETNQDGYHNLGARSTKRDGQILLVKRGVHTAEDMFNGATNDNAAAAWKFRVIGFLLMVLSIVLILWPLVTTVDIASCIPSSQNTYLIPLIAMIIALPTCLFIIAVGWLAYRPAIAIPVTLVSFFFIALFYKEIYKLNEEQKNRGRDLNVNNDDGSIEQNEYESSSKFDTLSSVNDPGHKYSGENVPNDGNMNCGTVVPNGDGGSGFANALEHAPPPYLATT
jgi:hypothetical protein